MAAEPQPIGIDITAQIFARMALASPSAENQTFIDAASGTDQDKLLQIARWLPSALQESMAQYRAGQGRGLVLCDQFGPVRMWYIPQKDSHTALSRVPQDLYDELDLCLAGYDPTAEAVLVLQSLHTARVIFVEADGQIRSREAHQRTPFQPQAPINLPPGVTSRRQLRPEGGATYEYTHATLGPLGRISILPFGVQSKLQTDFAGGEPSDPTLKERLELFQQIAQELHQKFHAMRGEDVPDPQAFNLDRMQAAVNLYTQFITADSSFELEQMVRRLSDDDLDKLVIQAKQAIDTASPHDALAIRQRLDDMEDIRVSPPAYSPLVGWLNDFIQAPTVDRAKAILREYPELLSQDAEAELEQFWAHDPMTQRRLDQRKKLWQKAYRRATSSQTKRTKSTSRPPEITPTMRVLMQSTLCLARGSGPIPRFLLRELDHPEITQDIDQALDDLITLKLLEREGQRDVYITREGYDFRDEHPADVMTWVSVSYAMCTLVQRLLEAEDANALEEVEIHLRALTNGMLRRPGVEALLLSSLLAIYLHNTGDDHDAIRYARELETMEQQMGRPQSNVVRLILYGDTFGRQADSNKTTLPKQLVQSAQTIDTWVKSIERRGGGNEQILQGMVDYMATFKQVMDSSSEDQMDLLCEQFPGFYRFARLLEDIAKGLQDGTIQIPE